MAPISRGLKVPSVKQQFAKTHKLVGLFISQEAELSEPMPCKKPSCQKAGDESCDKGASKKVRKAVQELGFATG